jgi:hypothetical protein
MNMNRNFPDGEDSVSLAMVTASEDSDSSGQGDSGSSDLGGGSGSERKQSERESGSGGSDHGGNSGGSDNGEQENNEENQDSNKPNEVSKKRRVMANRRSARESRDRRKRLLSDLQWSVDTLAADNSELAKSNNALRQELEQILQECGLTATLRDSLISNLSIQALLMGQGQVAGGGVMPNDSIRSTLSTLHSFTGSSTR